MKTIKTWPQVVCRTVMGAGIDLMMRRKEGTGAYSRVAGRTQDDLRKRIKRINVPYAPDVWPRSTGA